MQKRISFVSSTFNCSSFIDEFIKSLIDCAKKEKYRFEIVIVDDCSKDETWERLRHLANSKKQLRIIRLARNYGQQISISAGLRFVSNDAEVIIVLDSDGEHPVEAIPVMVNQILSGYDVVFTTSKNRNSPIDTLTSKLFWIVMKILGNRKIVSNQLMFKALSSRAVKSINLYQENARTVAAIISDIGLRTTTIQVKNQKSRVRAKSHTFFSRLNLSFNFLILGSTRIIDQVILFATSCFLTVLAFLVFSFFLTIKSGQAPSGYLTLFALIAFFGSITFVILAIVARFVANIYIEVLSRPLFHVERTVNVNK